jgi:Fic family protein
MELMDELTSKQKELERYKRYRESHKEERKKSVARSNAKRYINKLANIQELEELKELIDNKIVELKD